MAAYVMIDRLSMTDAGTFLAYSEPARSAVRMYGGRYVLPHGMQVEALEGNWKPNRIVLIEFDDGSQARRWWDSPEYAASRAIHRQATISNIILIEGTEC